MAKKPVASKSSQPKRFSDVIRDSARSIQTIAKALRDLIYEELPEAEERFYGGRRPMAIYRTIADVCYIQPQAKWCNVYLMRGTELTDPDHLLEGTSERFKRARVCSLDDLENLPLRAWLQESIALNEATLGSGMNFEQVLDKLRTICLALPNTKETVTWGIPHFRVGEKIFCGCSEIHARPTVGLKIEAHQSEMMMRLPGIEKAPYSRKGDGWVTIDPSVFDDWDEIERLLVGSYRLIAPKRMVALLDSPQPGPSARRRPTSARRSK